MVSIMNNKINIKWLVCVAMLGFHTTLSFAQQRSLKGRVVTSSGQPVAEAIISSPGCESVRTDKDGAFTLKGIGNDATVTVWRDGYFQRQMLVDGKQEKPVEILMIEESRTRYNETAVTPFATAEGVTAHGSMQNLNRKDFAQGALSLDRAMKGEFTGLQVTGKSGMTGEGSMMQLRGVH